MATIADGRTIPFDWYSDPAVLRLERERIFRRTWQYAGRADQVAEPGVFFTCDLGGVPIVVVRDEQHGLRAFLNVCRHRGSLVCEGEGKRASLQCPYHAWTYGLDGSLRAAPRSDLVPGFDKDEPRARAGPGRRVGPVRLRQPRPRGGPARGDARRATRPRRRVRHRPRLAAVPEAGERRRVRGQLEGLQRELPRVLPLPGRAPELLEGRRRLGRRVRARGEPHVLDASTDRCARPGRATSTRAARSSGASSTSSGRT